MLKGFNGLCQQQQFQTLLKINQLGNNVKKALAVMFYVNTTANNDGINAIINNIDEIAENNKDIVDIENYMDLNNLVTHGLYNNQCNS